MCCIFLIIYIKILLWYWSYREWFVFFNIFAFLFGLLNCYNGLNSINTMINPGFSFHDFLFCKVLGFLFTQIFCMAFFNILLLISSCNLYVFSMRFHGFSICNFLWFLSSFSFYNFLSIFYAYCHYLIKSSSRIWKPLITIVLELHMVSTTCYIFGVVDCFDLITALLIATLPKNHNIWALYAMTCHLLVCLFFMDFFIWKL